MQFSSCSVRAHSTIKRGVHHLFCNQLTLTAELENCWWENVLRTEVFKTRSTQKNFSSAHSASEEVPMGTVLCIWCHLHLCQTDTLGSLGLTVECLCGQKALFKLRLRDWQPDFGLCSSISYHYKYEACWSFSITLHFPLMKHMVFPDLEDAEHCSPIRESWTWPSAPTALNTVHHTGAP